MKLYELKGDKERRYSLFSWRTRLALAHKGVVPDYVPVLLSDKATIAFSGGTTVPVLVDGDRAVRDSWAIACYLEDRLPDAPSLFGGSAGRGVARLVNNWVDRAVLPDVISALALDALGRVHPEDRVFFRGMMEKAFRAGLEELAADRPKRIERFQRTLDPARATLKQQPFLGGDAPAYADYILFSPLQWARCLSPEDVLRPDDSLRAWRERMLDLHDGMARRVPDARA
ncbi:MAG TPA: glutathione S-transferase N-terminal domain-containing protein [Alphaproteobacteria bacterium]|jgi:glutathione S-transferase|nr:glutathione S-transferase N-terminal domain-containing protein [Alphaproteobacteria bacterium]